MPTKSNNLQSHTDHRVKENARLKAAPFIRAFLFLLALSPRPIMARIIEMEGETITDDTLGVGGRLGAGTFSPAAQSHVQTSSITTIGHIIQGSSGQIADLSEWQNSAGVCLASVTASGILNFSSGTISNFTSTGATLGTVTASSETVSVFFGTTGTTKLKGSSTNDVPAAGDYGEEISSYTPNIANAFINVSTLAWQNVAQITLTPGTWDVSGFVSTGLNAGTISRTLYAVSAFSGATTTDHMYGRNLGEMYPAIATYNSSGATLPWRVYLTGNTIYYVKCWIQASSTPQAVAAGITGKRLR